MADETYPKLTVPAAAAAPAKAALQALPALGASCTVRVGDGLVLTNLETGAHFAPGEVTHQTVTTTLLRRLADGDLVLVA